MEAKKKMMSLKDWKGGEKDKDWTAFNCLVDVAVAAREEYEKERLMKENMSRGEGFKIDYTVNNSPDFSENPSEFNHQTIEENKLVAFPRYVPYQHKPSLTKEKSVDDKPFTFIQHKTLTADSFDKQGFAAAESKNCRTSVRIFGTEISIKESETEEVSSKNADSVSPKKQSFQGNKPIEEQRVNLKRCFESAETSSGVKNQKRKKQKQNCMGIFCPGNEPPQPGLPERLKKMIKDMGGADEKLIIQKSLFKTDRSRHHNRLSIPMNQIKVEFLTDEEKDVLKEGSNNKDSKVIEALVIDPSLQTRDMTFKRWDMKKPSGKTCSIYALLKEWNSVVKDNNLKKRRRRKMKQLQSAHAQATQFGNFQKEGSCNLICL
ncbi:putative B3 domain-containing protein At3g24850 [Durio zibethinus]|uniref:B3 domain-containing protein At3g24850 n=1 Tax=Durio zibethinus TaxID=66656 RepID=A0A6P6A5Q1_DURZI|nr:putative B3 domain-containing protein At3g24850 [Durio zibethinus]